MNIGARIRARRRWLGLSQTVLAQRSGVHVVSIVRIEGGREPKPDTLTKLATAMDISVAALRDGDASRLTATSNPAA